MTLTAHVLQGDGVLSRDTESIAARKAALRKQIRAARATRSTSEQARLAGQLADELLPRLSEVSAVAAYLALPGEPDLAPVIDTLDRRGITVWLPVVTTLHDQPALVWGQASRGLVHGAATPSGLRLREPAPPHDKGPAVDVVLLPGLAVDRRGVRLGQGAGYYDRTAERLGWPSPSTRVVSIVHPDEVLDEVPGERHDLRATAICTAAGWIDCAG